MDAVAGVERGRCVRYCICFWTHADDKVMGVGVCEACGLPIDSAPGTRTTPFERPCCACCGAAHCARQPDCPPEPAGLSQRISIIDLCYTWLLMNQHLEDEEDPITPH